MDRDTLKMKMNFNSQANTYVTVNKVHRSLLLIKGNQSIFSTRWITPCYYYQTDTQTCFMITHIDNLYTR